MDKVFKQAMEQLLNWPIRRQNAFLCSLVLGVLGVDGVLQYHRYHQEYRQIQAKTKVLRQQYEQEQLKLITLNQDIEHLKEQIKQENSQHVSKTSSMTVLISQISQIATNNDITITAVYPITGEQLQKPLQEESAKRLKIALSGQYDSIMRFLTKLFENKSNIEFEQFVVQRSSLPDQEGLELELIVETMDQ